MKGETASVFGIWEGGNGFPSPHPLLPSRFSPFVAKEGRKEGKKRNEEREKCKVFLCATPSKCPSRTGRGGVVGGGGGVNHYRPVVIMIMKLMVMTCYEIGFLI